jgi:hypothetical protein
MNSKQSEPFYRFQFYKKIFFFFVILFSLPCILQAQKDTIKNKSIFSTKSKKFYSIIYIKTEILSFINNKNNVSASFPYHSSDINTGLTKNDTFKVSSSTPFKDPPIFMGIAFELNKNKNCFNFQFLVPINYYSSGSYGASISLGYGRAIDCSIRNKKFTIKPFLNVSEYYLDYHMGNIDNQNKYVFALGNTYNPTFKTTTYYKHTSSTTIHYVNNISLYYNMSFYTLCPQIIIANNRMRKIYWAFNFAWRIPVYSENGIKLEQDGGGENHVVSFTNSNLDVKVNGQKTSNYPYKLGGFIFGFSLGFYINR